MSKFEVLSKDYVSNCLIEAIKAKIKNPKIHLIICMPWENEVFCPHIMWSDGEADYDFGNEGMGDQGIKNWTLHKGHLRKWELGDGLRYKTVCREWKKRHPKKSFIYLHRKEN